MTHDPDIQERLLSVCVRWSEEIREIIGYDLRIAYMHRELPMLILDGELFREILASVVEGRDFPDIEGSTMFATEIILFRDPGREFSVRMYLWGPGEHDPIHDHNSWGVIGAVSGGLEVIKYKRLDDGTSSHHALIEESDRIVVQRGETTPVLPMNDGIHRTGNAGESTIVQVAVYGGNQTGRNYVHTFDTVTGRVSRLYSQQNKKRMLALDALRDL